MITLKNLVWSNCFSFGPDNELELDSTNVTQILGSNGMGKSSIPLIIEEVLYNKNSKGIKKADIPNRYINKGYDISLEFTKNEDRYLVTVSRKTTVKVVLLKNGTDISSHTATNTYKTIQEIIGVDFKTFSQLVYQSTNASLQFLTATDANRKKFLIDLLHLENYVELFNIFREAAKQSNQVIIEVSTVVATVENWLLDNKLDDTTILPMLKIEFDTDDNENEISAISMEISNISETNKKIITNNKYIELLKGININANSALKATKHLSYDLEQSEIGGLTQIIQQSQRTLTKLYNLGETCPTCNQTVSPEYHGLSIIKLTREIQKTKSQLDLLNANITGIKKNNAEFKVKQNTQQNWESIYRSIDRSLPTTTMDRKKLDGRLQRVRMELRIRKEQLFKLTKENEKRTRQNTRVEMIQEQSEGFEKKLEEAQEKLKIEELKASSLEILKKAFSTNGLLAYKIENLVKELEELTNTYLAELSDGRFTLEFVVSNDKLNVQITDNGNIVDILALSSGELARVNTATLIAIRKLMASISKSKINILFLDEIISVLDEQGREKLVEVLLGEEGLNTYIVSHEWQHPLLAKIEVVKVGNISHIEK